MRAVMVRSKASRLVKFIRNSHSEVYEYELLQGGYRRYGSARFYCSRVLSSNSCRNVNHRSWLQLGLLNSGAGTARSIHGTAPMAAKDYYETLGVSKNSTASEIKKAYHGLAKQLHPDHNKNDTEAGKKFQEVQKAYEVLKDDKKRAEYDQLGHESYESTVNGGGMNDSFWNPGFGPININDMRRMGGTDIKVAVELSFMEAVQGCSKPLTFQTELPCETCGGTGVPPGTRPETCKSCRGAGMISNAIGLFRIQTICKACNGSGKIVKDFCKSCSGARIVRGPKTIKLDITPGVDDNETIRVLGNGGADPYGYQPGNLYVTIRIRKDPVFRREGPDIHVDAVLNITQAILGGNIQVPTLSGDVILKVRPGTQPGQKVVLKKKGIKVRNSFALGDQYVHFNVSMPMNLTLRQQKLIEEYGKEEQEEEYKSAAAGGSV